MTDYRPRELARLVAEALRDFPVVVLTGPRQTGKTTLLQKDPALQDRDYLSLDDLNLLSAARRDPLALLRQAGRLSLDEVQRCPELLLALKQEVDRDRRPGRFLLSGSANLALLRGTSESLAGRAFYLELPPLTFREIRGLTGEPNLARLLTGGVPPGRTAIPHLAGEEILAGGMPAVALGQVVRRDLWFQGYEQTYLERDLREFSRVQDLIAFRAFLRLAALRTGSLLNLSHLARDAGLSPATVKRYLALLEASYLIRRIPPFLASRTSRLVKAPKLYLADSGLAAHLAGADRLDPGVEEPLRGALYETWAAQNLAALLPLHLPGLDLHFWHVQGRHEVDFILGRQEARLAVEIKARSRLRPEDADGLRRFLGAQPSCRWGILAYGGTELIPLGERLLAAPLAWLLS